MNQSRGMTIAGWVLTALGALSLIGAAIPKLQASPEFVEQFQKVGGFPPTLLRPIGVIELVVAIVFLIPRTRVLGGILVAAYFGGATVSNLRIGQPWIIPVLCGVVCWVGLWLRDPQLRELTPLTKR
jgi:hypothetical protein